MTSGEFILQCRDVEKLGSQGQAGLELGCVSYGNRYESEMSKPSSGGRIFYGSALYGIGTF